MIDESGSRLRVLTEFRVDRTLPKHNVPEDVDDRDDGSFRRGASRSRMMWANSDSDTGTSAFRRGDSILLFLWSKLIAFIKSPPRRPKLSVIEFFDQVKGGVAQIELYPERAAGYEAAIAKAKRCGQTALCEKLEQGREAVRSESALIALGLTKVISEATLVRFYKLSPKGLRLDWIENFTRMIPDQIAEDKRKCDEALVFDNYVVLHYDPKAKSYQQTQEQIRAERLAKQDPILFGLIEGRDQLYFIGEWVDEQCDLSLDQIADVLGDRGEVELDPQSYLGETKRQ